MKCKNVFLGWFRNLEENPEIVAAGVLLLFIEIILDPLPCLFDLHIIDHSLKFFNFILQCGYFSSRDFSSVDIASRNIFWKSDLTLSSFNRERNVSASRDIFNFLVDSGWEGESSGECSASVKVLLDVEGVLAIGNIRQVSWRRSQFYAHGTDSSCWRQVKDKNSHKMSEVHSLQPSEN